MDVACRAWAEARIRRLGPLRKAMKRWLADWDLCVGFMLNGGTARRPWSAWTARERVSVPAT